MHNTTKPVSFYPADIDEHKQNQAMRKIMDAQAKLEMAIKAAKKLGLSQEQIETAADAGKE